MEVFSPRRVAGGLACVAAGAMALASGAAPAGATAGPEVETGEGWSTAELSAEMSAEFGGDYVGFEVSLESGRHVIYDGGTIQRSDDIYVDVEVEAGRLSWTSNVQAIVAVEVEGEGGSNLYTYGDGDGSLSGRNLTWPGHDEEGVSWGGRHGYKISFCWKGGGHEPPTHPPTTMPSTTAPSTTAPSTTAPPTTAPSTTAPSETTAPSTTTVPEPEATTPTTQPIGDELPRTGNNTMPLVIGAVALVALGGGAFAGRRYLQQRAS